MDRKKILRQAILLTCVIPHLFFGLASAQAPESLDKDMQELRDSFGASAFKLREVYLPFCKPFATIDAIPVIKKEINEPIQILLSWPKGIADKAGVKQADRLVAVNGISVIGIDSKEFREKIWSGAKEASADNKTAMKLTFKTATAEGEVEKNVSVQAKWVCAEFTPLVKEESLFRALEESQKLGGFGSKDTLLMPRARNIAFVLLDEQSTGKAVNVLGGVLALAGAVRGMSSQSLSGVQGITLMPRPYTDNDFLKADALAMLLLQKAGEKIEPYLQWALREGMAFSDTEKNKRPYDASSSEKLKAIHAAVVARQWQQAADIVSLKLNARQKRVFTSARNTAPTEESLAGLNWELRKNYSASGFASLTDVDAVPNLGPNCKERYAQWIKRSNPKAFAISDKGHCTYPTGANPSDPALSADPAERALQLCAKDGARICRLYAIDDDVVWKPQ